MNVETPLFKPEWFIAEDILRALLYWDPFLGHYMVFANSHRKILVDSKVVLIIF